jgi:hypothetical protein
MPALQTPRNDASTFELKTNDLKTNPFLQQFNFISLGISLVDNCATTNPMLGLMKHVQFLVENVANIKENDAFRLTVLLTTTKKQEYS